MPSVPFFDRAAVTRLLDRARTMDTVTRAPLDPLLMMMVSICMLDESMRRAGSAPSLA